MRRELAVQSSISPPICPQASACSSLRGPSAPARSHEWASRYAAGGGGGGLGGLGGGGFGGLGGSIGSSCSVMAGPAAGVSATILRLRYRSDLHYPADQSKNCLVGGAG